MYSQLLYAKSHANSYIFSGKTTTQILQQNNQCTDYHYKKILIPKDLHKPKFQQKGVIIVWPQKRTTFYYNKELVWISWLLAHTLYWLHVIDFLPSGSAIQYKQPPWKYEPPLHKPKSRDFIIEPDWDSK